MNRNERIAVFVQNPKLLKASPKEIQRALGRGVMELKHIRDAKAVASSQISLMDSTLPLSDQLFLSGAGY